MYKQIYNSMLCVIKVSVFNCLGTWFLVVELVKIIIIYDDQPYITSYFHMYLFVYMFVFSHPCEQTSLAKNSCVQELKAIEPVLNL